MQWLRGLSLLLFFSCGSSDKKAEKNFHLDQQDTVLSGGQLSLKYCQSCHLYPAPNTLDKNTWERSVLPLMGRLFGIYEKNVPRSKIIEGAINKKLVIDLNIFPDKQLISDGEWQKITDYYISTAPDSGRYSSRKDISFAPIELNNDFEIVYDIKLPTPPTDIRIGDNWLALTLAGSLRLAPSNNPFGELVYLFRNPGEEKYSSFRKFVSDLSRPVQTVFEDVNGNGFEDILIAEFGYYTGALTLYENSGDNRNLYKKNILKDVPGAVRAYVEDMNRDGHKDIVALFAQGDESISILYNDGQGGFKEERVLRFNPSYGSVYFELIDMNNDGYLDILYCNGDNGDYPPILKDYHGIRVFENDGNNNFEQVYFLPHARGLQMFR